MFFFKVRAFIRFVLFNFMYFFTNKWAANFEMVLFIANMTSLIPLAGHYPQECELSQNLHFFIKSLVFWLWVLWLDLFSFFLKILSILVVGWDLRILQACLHVSSAAWPVLITLDRVRSDSQRSLSQRELSLVPHTIISLIRKSWTLSNSHSELNFFHSVTKSWKFWSSCYLYVIKLATKNGYVFPRVTVFQKFVYNRH